MVSALLDHVEATLCVDVRRVYATGMSDGGAMTSVLACVAPTTFAAFGPVAVQLAPPSCGDHPVSMVAFHGTADPIVPYAGGKVNCCGGAILGYLGGQVGGAWGRKDVKDPTGVDFAAPGEVIRVDTGGFGGGGQVGCD